MMNGKKGILRIAAAKAPAHTAHQGYNFLPCAPSAVGCVRNLTDTFDARNDWFLYVVVLNFKLTQNLFGMVHAECFHFYKHPARLYLRHRYFR